MSWLGVVTAEFSRPGKKDTRLRAGFWKTAKLEVEGELASSPVAKPSLKDTKAKVDTKLWAALRKARTANCTSKSRTELLQYLAGARDLNATEFGGLTTHFLEREHPSASKVSLRLCCAFMRTIKRLGLDARDQTACLKLQPIFEATCLASWSSMRRDIVDWREWWQVMSVPGSLCRPEATVAQIRDARDIDSVMADIRARVATSMLGRRLFGVYLSNSDSASITAIVADEPTKLLHWQGRPLLGSGLQGGRRQSRLGGGIGVHGQAGGPVRLPGRRADDGGRLRGRGALTCLYKKGEGWGEGEGRGGKGGLALPGA